MSSPARWLLRSLGGLAGGLVLFGVGVWGLGGWLAQPARARVGAPPAGIGASEISLRSAAGAQLVGWAAPGTCGCGTVVLLHGVRGNRLGVVDRIRLFHEAGFATVAVDLQAHGESTGEHIAYGARERYDAQTAVAYARTAFPGQPVAVVGVSLGGAAALLAEPDLGADALVLEAVYSDIEAATRNRLRLYGGRPAALLTPLLLQQLPLRIGVQPRDLQPVEAIRKVRVPLLIVAGTHDEHTTADDTRRLYAAAPAPKTIWWVEQARYVDFLSYDPAGYRRHVLRFVTAQLASRSSVR